MKKIFFLIIFLAAIPKSHAAQQNAPDWRVKLASSMPLLGHRNWVLIVDSAYPLQNSSGIETIETNSDQLDVVRAILNTIHNSIHVRPDIYMDAELPYISEQELPGVTAYRARIAALLANYKVAPVLHDKLIANIAEAGNSFNVIVLKTNMTIPYTSVFIRLDCKYWNDEQEQELRSRMKASVK